MKRVKKLMIAKRDGSIEEFEFGKLRRALAIAMRECRYDDRYADALARAVAMHLKRWSEPYPPSSHYIYRCVRTVLKETGLSDVAAQIAVHRRKRTRHRERVRVFDAARPERGRQPWRKASVVAVLQKEHELSRPTARILAGEVESRIFDLKYDEVSSALVSEVIRIELMAWGLLSGMPAAQPEVKPDATDVVETNPPRKAE